MSERTKPESSRGCDGDHCKCDCHYLACLPGGGVHDYCYRCSGDPPAVLEEGCGYD